MSAVCKHRPAHASLPTVSVAQLDASKTFTRCPTSVSVVRAPSGADALLGQVHPHLGQVGIVGSCEAPVELLPLAGKTHTNKAIINESNLLWHMKTHTNEKSCKCDQCKKDFTQAIYIAKHVTTHSGEKPYICIQCDKRFT